ncbi:MAG: NUDIX hydrolase [Phycisphaerae bacterium]|jgi:ADP-ribose pyrophosphatase
MATDYSVEKLTDSKWLNLYEVTYTVKTGRPGKWTVASRKSHPIQDADIPDAVVIVPVVETVRGKRLVVTKEFRVPLWDYEYGFPAGLIDRDRTIEQVTADELKEETGLDLVRITHTSGCIYSSGGMTDESCIMVFVEAGGQISDEHLEEHEKIEAVLMDVPDLRELLDSGKKISAKAWGLFYHYCQIGKIY